MKSKLALLLLLFASAAVTHLGCADSGGRNGVKGENPIYGPGSTGNIARVASIGTQTGG